MKALKKIFKQELNKGMNPGMGTKMKSGMQSGKVQERFEEEIKNLLVVVGQDFCNKDDLYDHLMNNAKLDKKTNIWGEKITNNFLEHGARYHRFKSAFATVVLKCVYNINNLEELVNACATDVIDNKFLLHYAITLIVVENDFEKEKIRSDLEQALATNKSFYELYTSFIDHVINILDRDDKMEDEYTLFNNNADKLFDGWSDIIPHSSQQNNSNPEIADIIDRTEELKIDNYDTKQEKSSKAQRDKIYEMIKSVIKEADVIDEADSDHSDNEDIIEEKCLEIFKIYEAINHYLEYNVEKQDKLVNKFIKRLGSFIDDDITSTKDQQNFIKLLCDKCDYEYNNLSDMPVVNNILDKELVELLSGFYHDINSSVSNTNWDVM